MEPWLSGPVPGVDPMLQPAAHALLHAARQIPEAVLGTNPPLSEDAIWRRPGSSVSPLQAMGTGVDRSGASEGGAASIGFHLRHLAGSTDRLLTYARGEQLSDGQRSFLKIEGVREAGAGVPRGGAELVADAVAALERAIEVIRATPASQLLDKRVVGRMELPTNLHGLLFHVAEHAQRHTGQLVTTVKVVQGELGADGR